MLTSVRRPPMQAVYRTIEKLHALVLEESILTILESSATLREPMCYRRG